MRISAKIDYGCRALLELALHWPISTPLQINTISKRQNIPIKFLTQILINLKQLGYVQSLRGKKGGYLLAKAPQEINLSDLITNFGSIGYSVAENRKSNKDNHIISQIWQEIDTMVLRETGKINFEIICNRQRSSDNVFMFQI
jgi:Rrf2 family transcriptional regulator, cysteine metabolism repressor